MASWFSKSIWFSHFQIINIYVRIRGFVGPVTVIVPNEIGTMEPHFRDIVCGAATWQDISRVLITRYVQPLIRFTNTSDLWYPICYKGLKRFISLQMQAKTISLSVQKHEVINCSSSYLRNNCSSFSATTAAENSSRGTVSYLSGARCPLGACNVTKTRPSRLITDR